MKAIVTSDDGSTMVLETAPRDLESRLVGAMVDVREAAKDKE